MLTLTYEFKLIPSQEQGAIIEDMLTVTRKVWNYALRGRKDWYNSRKCSINFCSLEKEYIIPADAPYPNYNVQAANLTRAKKSKCDSFPRNLNRGMGSIAEVNPLAMTT